MKMIIGLLMLIGISAEAQTYVNGYYKSNGTYVAPHYRTKADSNPYNNYNYKPVTDYEAPLLRKEDNRWQPKTNSDYWKNY